ncbi:glycoside hydrolase family 26 protein [Candidatus Margulisiibacteriota bacterium]
MIKKHLKKALSFGVYTPNPGITLRPLQKKLGFHIPIVLIFRPWGTKWKKKMEPFPAKLCRFISKNKSIPFIKWEPATWTTVPNKMINDYPLEKIAGGEFDIYIEKWARDAKSFKKQIWLSFGHEMNGFWYHWAGKSRQYKKALLHIYIIFRKLKVKNVRWVFCVNNYPFDYAEYFPRQLKKDKRVIIGIDGYNAEGIWGLKWKPFEHIFGIPYSYTLKHFPGNKIIIGEFSCAKKGGDRNEWINDAFKSLKNDHKKISALIWFNVDKEADWRIF